MKLLTLEDYQKAADIFFPLFEEVHDRLRSASQEYPSIEETLKVMEAVGGVALKLALEEKEAPFGFNKKDKEVGPDEC